MQIGTMNQPVAIAQPQRVQGDTRDDVTPNQSAAITHKLVQREEKQLLTDAWASFHSGKTTISCVNMKNIGNKS